MGKHTQLYARGHTRRSRRIRRFFYNMFDTDLFIQCIHARPALWEKANEDYCDKNCREKAWFEIGAIMHEKWPHMESAERNEKGKVK